MEEYDEFFLNPKESNVDAISLKVNGDILSSLSNDKKITITMNGNVMNLNVGDISYEFKTEKLSTPSYIYQHNYEDDSLKQVGMINKKFASINYNPSEEYISQRKQINEKFEISKKNKGINQPKKKEPITKKVEMTKAKKPINTIPPKSTIQTKINPPKPKINESKPVETRAPINHEIKSKTVEPPKKDEEEEEDDFLQLGLVEIKKEPIPTNSHNNSHHPSNPTKTSPKPTTTANNSTITSPTNTLTPNPSSSNNNTLNKKVDNFVSKNKFLNNTNNTTTTPLKDIKEVSESSSHAHDSLQKDKSSKTTSLNNSISTNKSNYTKKQEVNNTPVQPKTSLHSSTSSNHSNSIFSSTNDENHNDVNLTSNKKQEIPQKNKNGNHLPPSSVSSQKKYERPIDNHKNKTQQSSNSLSNGSTDEITFNRSDVSNKIEEYNDLLREGRELHKELTSNSEYFLNLKRKFLENPERKQDIFNQIQDVHDSRKSNIQKKLRRYKETCKKMKEIEQNIYMIQQKFPSNFEKIGL